MLIPSARKIVHKFGMQWFSILHSAPHCLTLWKS
jgi:hypothetical protein